MTRPVIVTRSGKVVGIKGLYRSPSGRYYVRYARLGFDKQMTITPISLTFSGLQKAAQKALTALKAQAKSEFAKSGGSVQLSEKDELELSQAALVAAIKDHWGRRGCSQGRINQLLFHTREMCLCSGEKMNIKAMDKRNAEIASALIENDEASDNLRRQIYSDINCVFSELIRIGAHKGYNPVNRMVRPRTCQCVRVGELDFNEAARAIIDIRDDYKSKPVNRAESELFLRLCIETGQRPRDVHEWTLSEMSPDGHFLFKSHKTGTKHRVSHLISKASREIAFNIILMRGGITEFDHNSINRFSKTEVYRSFWSHKADFYSRYINEILRKVAPGKILYLARHFFISEVFRMTGSEFWAEVFTHEGKSANTRHYLHADQAKADQILMEISDRLEVAIEAAKKAREAINEN